MIRASGQQERLPHRTRHRSEEKNGLIAKSQSFFLVIALIAYLVGARGVTGFSIGIAKILIVVFVVLFVAPLVFGLVFNTRDRLDERRTGDRMIEPQDLITLPATLSGWLMLIVGLVILWVIVSIPVYFAGRMITGGKARFGQAMGATLGGGVI